MADFGKLAIISAIQDKSLGAFTDRGVKPEMMPDASSQSVLKYMYDFNKQHGAVPGPQTVETAFPTYQLNGWASEPLSYYVSLIIDQYARAEAADVLLAQARKLRGGDVFSVVSATQSAMGKLNMLNTHRVERSIDENTIERWQRYLDRKNGVGITGIATPWGSLDDMTQGWQEEDYIVIVARPKVGKTWMMLRLAYAAWKQGKKVMFVNRELPDKMMEQRWDSLHSLLPYQNFRTGIITDAEEQRYKDALAQLAGGGGLPDWVWVHGAMTVSAVDAKIEEHKPDIVFVDGAYLMMDDEGAKLWWERNMNISRALKRIPQKRKIPLIASTQLGRGGDTKKNKDNVLTLTDVGGSDAYAQDADLLLGLDQPGDMYLKKQLLIIPLAVREAPPDPIVVGWDFDTMLSDDLGKQAKTFALPDDGKILVFED